MNRDELVEKVARALCEADGYDPEYLEPGDCGYRDDRITIDGHNRKGEPCHFFWRHYETPAIAVLTAMAEHLIKELGDGH